MAESAVSMKLSIDSRGKRVVFAEADKDCVDFLLQILSLPVATIINLLGAQGMTMKGCLPNIYKSLEDLDDTYIQPNQKKDTFLEPVSSCSIPLLGLQHESTDNKTIFSCPYCSYTGDPVNLRGCQSPLDRDEYCYAVPPAMEVAVEDCGLVKGVVKYMVMDNLTIKPMSTISAITLLNKVNFEEVEEKVVTLGMKEAVKLLKASLESNNVLTDVFCY